MTGLLQQARQTLALPAVLRRVFSIETFQFCKERLRAVLAGGGIAAQCSVTLPAEARQSAELLRDRRRRHCGQEPLLLREISAQRLEALLQIPEDLLDGAPLVLQIPA